MATDLVVSAEAVAGSINTGNEEEDDDGIKLLREDIVKHEETVAKGLTNSIIWPLLLLPVIVTIQYAITSSFDLLYETQTQELRVAYAWAFAAGMIIISLVVYLVFSNNNKKKETPSIKRKKQKQKRIKN